MTAFIPTAVDLDHVAIWVSVVLVVAAFYGWIYWVFGLTVETIRFIRVRHAQRIAQEERDEAKKRSTDSARSTLTMDELVKVVRSLSPRPPVLRVSQWLPRGTAYEVRLPDEFRRPSDPEVVIYANPEDIAEAEREHAEQVSRARRQHLNAIINATRSH